MLKWPPHKKMLGQLSSFSFLILCENYSPLYSKTSLFKIFIWDMSQVIYSWNDFWRLNSVVVIHFHFIIFFSVREVQMDFCSVLSPLFYWLHRRLCMPQKSPIFNANLFLTKVLEIFLICFPILNDSYFSYYSNSVKEQLACEK